MRVENTTPGQIHLTLNDVGYAVPGRTDGRNGACEIPAEALAHLGDGDGIQKALFESGALVKIAAAKPEAPAVKAVEPKVQEAVEATQPEAKPEGKRSK